MNDARNKIVFIILMSLANWVLLTTDYTSIKGTTFSVFIHILVSASFICGVFSCTAALLSVFRKIVWSVEGDKALSAFLVFSYALVLFVRIAVK